MWPLSNNTFSRAESQSTQRLRARKMSFKKRISLIGLNWATNVAEEEAHLQYSVFSFSQKPRLLSQSKKHSKKFFQK